MRKSNTLTALLLSAIVFTVFLGVAYAEEPELRKEPQSQKYLDYWALSEEERSGMIMPFPVDITLNKELNMKSSSLIPERFDAREHEWLSPVSDQMQTNSCWTFATSLNLESLLRKSGEGEYIFSERHMDNATAQNPNDLTNPYAFSRKSDAGGNFYLSAAYYMNGAGPVNASDMPFQNNSIPEATANLYQKPAARVLDYQFLPVVSSSISSEDKASISELIKRGVMEYGSIAVGINMQSSGLNIANSSYFFSSNSYTINHAVTIIGWDDSYSRNNFNTVPSMDGAWIVQNSWGPGWGNDGYCYVSYDESDIYTHISTVSDVSSDIEYDNRYILDPLGWSTTFSYEGRTSAYCANVFKKTSAVERLTEVTFGNYNATSYEIYVNPNGSSLESSALVLAASGTIDFAGYKTVKLENPINLAQNEFAVVVKYISSGGDVKLPAESSDSGNWATADAEPNSSFLSSNGNGWSEISNENGNYSNCSIKAFTQDVTPKTKIICETSDPTALVYITDDNAFEISPKADGTFAVAGGDYTYNTKIYRGDSVTARFGVPIQNQMTLYAYLNPAELSEAKTQLNELFLSYGQSWSIDTLRNEFGKRVGSSFNLSLGDDFSVTPPSEQLNGSVDGTVTIADAYRNQTSPIIYDNEPIFKAQISENDTDVISVTGTSDTVAQLMIASYAKDGSLIDTSIMPINIVEGESIAISYETTVGASSYKVFLWDNDRLYPYAQSIQ